MSFSAVRKFFILHSAFYCPSSSAPNRPAMQFMIMLLKQGTSSCSALFRGKQSATAVILTELFPKMRVLHGLIKTAVFLLSVKQKLKTIITYSKEGLSIFSDGHFLNRISHKETGLWIYSSAPFSVFILRHTYTAPLSTKNFNLEINSFGGIQSRSESQRTIVHITASVKKLI